MYTDGAWEEPRASCRRRQTRNRLRRRWRGAAAAPAAADAPPGAMVAATGTGGRHSHGIQPANSVGAAGQRLEGEFHRATDARAAAVAVAAKVVGGEPRGGKPSTGGRAAWPEPKTPSVWHTPHWEV